MSTPVIRLSDSARRALREAAVGGDPLRIRISERFDCDLFLGSPAEDDVEVDCGGGITLLLDPLSAQCAEGLSIDFLSGPEGFGFEIVAPPRVKQVSAAELKAMMDRAVPSSWSMCVPRKSAPSRRSRVRDSSTRRVTPTC
jgi:monothiol glutaredoxin